jgi:hypothetical protein
MLFRSVAVALAVVVLSGLATACGGGGGGGEEQAGGTTYAVETVEVPTVPTTRNCKGLSPAKQKVQRLALQRDLRDLRAAAATVKGYTQNGNAALNRALDKFQLDIKEEALPVKKRSRFIDLAAAIVSPKCYLCFQALEANRPIAGGAKLACG